MSVYHTVHTISGPSVIAFACYFCQCPRAKIPYSCILDYGRPVPSSLQLLHSVLLNRHYQSRLSRTSTWSHLTKTSNSSLHDALTFYLHGNLWLLYLELYVHYNPDIIMAQPVASIPHLTVLLSTSATVATSSSSSTVTSCTSILSRITILNFLQNKFTPPLFPAMKAPCICLLTKFLLLWLAFNPLSGS